MSEQSSQRLQGRVVVITGAGRGLGAAYARLAAREGAKVVVNDLGRGLDGSVDESPAEAVVREIVEGGGQAIVDTHDVADFEGARALIDAAVTNFGGLDVVINNAGNLRDRMLANMSEQEWDDVIRVHMRGHFAVSRHAAAYWRDKAKASGEKLDAVLIQTTSIAGLHGNMGQVNYSSAKSGLATMAYNIHLEMNERVGVRSYAVAPSARTRLTLNSPGAVEVVSKPLASGFDYFDPENVAPFVVWLGMRGCPAPSGSIFGVEGDVLRRYDAWHIATTVKNGKRWTFEEIERRGPELFAGHERAFTPLSEIMNF